MEQKATPGIAPSLGYFFAPDRTLKYLRHASACRTANCNALWETL